MTDDDAIDAIKTELCVVVGQWVLEGDAAREQLLRVASLAVGIDEPLPEVVAVDNVIRRMTGHPYPIETYSDAAHAIRCWAAQR